MKTTSLLSMRKCGAANPIIGTVQDNVGSVPFASHSAFDLDAQGVVYSIVGFGAHMKAPIKSSRREHYKRRP